MKKPILIVAVLFLVSCGSAKLIAPTQADAERGMQKYPSLTLDELNAGKMHFEQQCTKCHGIKQPSKFTEAEWTSIVPKMAAKANKKAGSEVVDAAKQESILRYVLTMRTVK